ncbi:MAG TPA: hypothetical protein VFD62_18775 [Pyrinomonadaceae bacterium]|nr:hypothetical protein [Pyrinomonadaceae bacterium]
MVAMVPRLLLLTVVLCTVSFAQEQEKSSGPRTELLTSDGGKPNLSATGDGITSYKANGVYHRGKATVSTPMTRMQWHDGEYLREFEAGKPLKVQNGLTLHQPMRRLDGVLVCRMVGKSEVIEVVIERP